MARSREKNNNGVWIGISVISILVIIAVVVLVGWDIKKNAKPSESETTASSSVEELETTAATSETEGASQGIYSSYGLSAGESIRFAVDQEFQDNTGMPDCYDDDKAEYNDGLFVDTSSMMLLISVSTDYTKSIHVQWYHVEADGTENLVSETSGIYPSADEGVNWYETSLSATDMGGSIPVGEYFAVVYAEGYTEPSVVTKMEYRTSN